MMMVSVGGGTSITVRTVSGVITFLVTMISHCHDIIHDGGDGLSFCDYCWNHGSFDHLWYYSLKLRLIVHRQKVKSMRRLPHKGRRQTSACTGSSPTPATPVPG